MKNNRLGARILNPLKQVGPFESSLAPNNAAIQRFLRTKEEEVAELCQGGLCHLEINRITADQKQARKYFDPKSLEELSQSIKKKGVLQPILITKTEIGEIQIVAGERRLRAAKMAGLTTIPALLVTGDPTEISLIENLQRENLTPIEEAEGLAQMMREHDYTIEDLSRAVNKAPSTLSETLSLNRLPEAIKEEIRCAQSYSKRLLVEIAKEETAELMISLFKHVKEKNVNGSAIRQISRQSERHSRNLETMASKRISSMITYLKTLDQQKVSLVMDELKSLKSFLEEIMNQ